MQNFDDLLMLQQERRKRAQSLLDQDMPRQQGQIIGKRYIPPSFDDALVGALRQYGAMKDVKDAEQQIGNLQTQRTEASNKALADFLRQSQGAPAQATGQMFQTGANEMGDESATVPQWQAAQAPNLRGAYASLLQSPDTGMRQAGMQGLASMPKMEADAAEREASRQFRIEQLNQQHQQRMEMLSAQNASREQMAEANRQHQIQMKQMFGALANQQPYFQPLQTAQGVMAFNARTGKVEPVSGANNQPVIGAANDPALQANIAGAKTGAQTEAKARTEARIDAPKVIAQGEETIKLVDDLLKAPGFKQAVGGSRLLQIQRIPGTSAKDFDVRLDQLKGKQFLQAFETLKGGGAITEVEGKKATDAIARMDAAGSEQEFINAAREFQDVIRLGIQRARQAQGSTAPAAPTIAPQDQAALDWANANPNDPRSVAIKQRLGVR